MPGPRFSIVLTLVAALVATGCSSKDSSGPPPVVPDTKAPSIVSFRGPSDAIQPGDSITFLFLARDSSGIKSVSMEVHGSFEEYVYGEFDDRPREFDGWIRVATPVGASIVVPAIANLAVTDDAGNTSYAETRVWLVDKTRPTALVEFRGLHADSTIRTGEQLDIYVTGLDNHRLRYVGYEVNGVRDSVDATGVRQANTFRLTVPTAWNSRRPFVKAWARDASGNLSDNFEAVRSAPVYDWVEHAMTTASLPPECWVQQALLDEKRNVVYRLCGGYEGPTGARIDGVYLNAGTNLQSIALSEFPFDFSFSGSGDSLIVLRSGHIELGIVDLLPPVRSATVLPLQFPSPVPLGPAAVRPSGTRLFVALINGAWGSRLLDINLATGAQVIRTDLDGGPDIPASPSLLRLPDDRLVVGPGIQTYSTHRYIYSPVSNSFTLTFRLRSISQKHYAPSPSGRFMMGNTLFGPALDSLTTVETQDWGVASEAVAALSPDGLFAYLSTRFGYQKVRLSDGVILEQVKIGMSPLYLFAAADGNRLVAVGESLVKVIDLR